MMSAMSRLALVFEQIIVITSTLVLMWTQCHSAQCSMWMILVYYQQSSLSVLSWMNCGIGNQCTTSFAAEE